MELKKRVIINYKDMRLRVSFQSLWKGCVPVYLTEDKENAYAIMVKDNFTLIVISRFMMEICNEYEMEAVLWHEISHLYYMDCIQEWKIENEFRADLLSAQMTSYENIINFLIKARQHISNVNALRIVDKRIEFLNNAMINNRIATNTSEQDILKSIKFITVVD